MKFSYASPVMLLLVMFIFLVPHKTVAQEQEEIPLLQTYQHESGIGYHIFEALNMDMQDNYGRGSIPAHFGFMAFSYGGRFTPKSFGDNAGVSVGFKGALAFSLSSFGSYIVFNMPITADFNVGHAATIGSTSGMGGFIGAGLDFNYVGVPEFRGSPYFLGPIVSGGARFMLRNTSNTIRLSKSYDVMQNRGVILVFSLTTNIGE